MTDRTTKVTLVAQVSNYIAGMQKAAAATKATGTEAEKLAQKKQAMSSLGTTFLAFGAAAAAGVFVAVKAFADFDAKMSQVKTLSHATGAEMAALTDAALKMGQKIGFSASQVADAEIELVKAGVSVKDILGGALSGALQLAAAGQIDVAQATEIATIALTQFGLKGKDVPHVADLLAAGADKALGGVSDLGEALKSGGLVAHQFGLSLDETVGVLSAFANAGLIGEVGGTDLRQMLLKLADPSKQAAADMKNLGISLYDASGKFVGPVNLAGQLHDKLKGLTEAQRNSTLATIFGARAIAGANVLYKEGAKGIGGWIGRIQDSGFAAQQAAGKMDNLQGDAKKLAAAFENDLIKSGSTLNGVLRTLTQGITFVLGSVANLPTPVLAAGLAITGLVAVVGLVGGTAFKVLPAFTNFKTSLDLLGISAKATSIAIGGIGAALALATVVIGAAITEQANAKAATDAYADSLDKATGSVTDYTKSLVAKGLQENGAFDAAKKFGIGQKELVTAITEGGAAIDSVRQKIEANSKSINGGSPGRQKYASEARLLNIQLDQQGKIASDGVGEWKNLNAAQSTGTDVTMTAASTYETAAQKAKDLADQVSNLTDQINTANGVGQDAVTTNANYQKALSEADDTIKKAKDGVKGYTLGVDESTAAGSANVAMLADLAKKGQDAADKQLALDGNTKAYAARLAATRKAVIQRALDLGATAAQAQAIADKVAAIPTDVQIKVLADTYAAQTAVDALNASLDRASRARTIVANIGGGSHTQQANGGLWNHGVQAFADGGVASGIYAGRPGGIIKFAEPETGWEAYISGKPGQEARNRMIWREAGARLGVGAGGSGGALPPIYVQNPFTGEYLLAQVDGRARAQVNAAADASKTKLQNGKQKLQF